MACVPAVIDLPECTLAKFAEEFIFRYPRTADEAVLGPLVLKGKSPRRGRRTGGSGSGHHGRARRGRRSYGRRKSRRDRGDGCFGCVLCRGRWRASQVDRYVFGGVGVRGTKSRGQSNPVGLSRGVWETNVCEGDSKRDFCSAVVSVLFNKQESACLARKERSTACQ